ncbi:MAG: amidohydrolase family protein [Phycisphaeraceae bacterium]|nr:amidohydrolase family protein [Phycisphaeraceae bacterium]
MTASSSKRRPTRILVAAAIRDAAGVNARPGAVAVRDGRIVSSGPADLVLNDKALDPSVVRTLPGVCLLPGLVNAHSHLELSRLGPRPYDASRGFTGWVAKLRQAAGPLDKIASARQGARASLAAGVCAVGDIASSRAVIETVRDAGLTGVGYLELFGLGETKVPPVDPGVGAEGVGYQPHAPYSAGPGLFKAAVESGLPVCTHLAETLEEHRFVRDAGGPFRELLEDLDKWRDEFAVMYRGHASSIQWMRPHLEARPWLLAHCNYVSDDDMKLLADTGASVAYCPIASDYFGHSGHRYRQMLEMGVNVCLGTDSILCQPKGETSPHGILPQMRYLFQRDRTDPDLLLKMATVNGARALDLPDDFATLRPGAQLPGAHLLTAMIDPHDETDPLRQLLREDQNLEVLHV